MRTQMRTLPFLFATLLWAQESGSNPRSTPADVAAGAATFRSHCAACHGFQGEGGRGPALNTGRFYHATTDSDLLNIISDGIPGTEMPGLFYSPDRVWQVVAFLRSLGARPAPRGDPGKGAALYQSLGCAQCHRIAGTGGRLGPELTEIGRTRAAAHLRQAIIDPNADVRQRYWVVSFAGADGSRREGFLMNEDTYTVQFMDLNEKLHSVEKASVANYKVEKISKMPSFKDRLSPPQLDDLVAYLASLRWKGDGH